MKKIAALFFTGSLFTLAAAPIPGVPRDSNNGNTGAYDSTRVEAQLVVPVKADTEVLHFIRDNNDPRVITKTYELKHVDPYEFRDYLRQMVQSKRVGNTSLQQAYPDNTRAPNVATVTAPEITTPVNAQNTYNPQPQLGSNTAVECLKFADGTGLLFVSAEEYRFKDHENGMGIDTLVSILDNPRLGELSFGSQIFFYLPKFVPARNLLPLIQNVGMNISDVTEIWQGQDIVAYDPDLNWLIFDTANFSCANIAKILKKYDTPIPQVRLKIKVYEVYQENDDKIGIDFQSWKNNEGVNFFSAGGRFRNNWGAMYGAGIIGKPYGSEHTSFYNFNPKWNTRYIDFLVSKGRAEVVHTGELVIRNNTPASLARTTQIFYADDSENAVGSIELPDTGVGPYELLSNIIGRTFDRGDKTKDIPVGKGSSQNVTAHGGFGFTMKVENASVNLNETRFSVTLNNTSLIGFNSSGAPRISTGNTVKQEVSLPHGFDSFVIGGLRKQEEVTSRTGIPFLMDIPGLGYLFSSESKSVKHAELIVTAQCEWEAPEERLEGGTVRYSFTTSPQFNYE